MEVGTWAGSTVQCAWFCRAADKFCQMVAVGPLQYFKDRDIVADGVGGSARDEYAELRVSSFVA